MVELLRAVWRYRFFILSSVRNDLRARVARSQLGAAWMVLQPLAQVAIFSLVLSEVLGARIPGVAGSSAYPVYLMAGLLCWSLFNEITTRCLGIFVENAGLLKKIAFPRICLPLIAAGSALLNNLLLLAAMAAVFALLGHPPTIALAWLPALMLLTTALALGLGLLLGVINVFVRDVGQVMTIVLQLLFWLTPIVYMPSVVPARFAGWLAFNPLAPLVAAYQRVILYGQAPVLDAALGWTALLALLLLGAALLLFRRSAPDMVDVL